MIIFTWNYAALYSWTNKKPICGGNKTKNKCTGVKKCFDLESLLGVNNFMVTHVDCTAWMYRFLYAKASNMLGSKRSNKKHNSVTLSKESVIIPRILGKSPPPSYTRQRSEKSERGQMDSDRLADSGFCFVCQHVSSSSWCTDERCYIYQRSSTYILYLASRGFTVMNSNHQVSSKWTSEDTLKFSPNSTKSLVWLRWWSSCK